MSIRTSFNPMGTLGAAVELADELVYGVDKFLDFTELLPVEGVEVVLTRFAASPTANPVNMVAIFALSRATGGDVRINKYSLPSVNVSRQYLYMPGRAVGWLGTPGFAERLPGTFSVTVEDGLWTVTNPYGDVATGQETEAGVQTRLTVGRTGNYSAEPATPTWSAGIGRVTLTRNGVRYDFLPRADQTGMYCTALKKNIRLSTI